MMLMYGSRREQRSGGVSTGERSNALLINRLCCRDVAGGGCGNRDFVGPLAILPARWLVTSTYRAAPSAF